MSPPHDSDDATLATARQRGLAYVLDLCLVGGPLFALVHDEERSLRRDAASFLALGAVVATLYHVVLEGATGRTAGKALVGIEVTRTDGSACTFAAATIRTAARVVDALPIGYAIGLWSIATSSDRQRLGDRAASTIVVRRREPSESRKRERTHAQAAGVGGSEPGTISD